MLTVIQNELKRPVPLAFAVLAALGWIIFIVYWFDASGDRRALESSVAELQADREQVSSQLEAHREASRTHAELVEAIEVAQAELTELETRRDQADEQATNRVAELDQAEVALANAQDDLAAARSEFETVSAETETARAEASQRADELAEASEEFVQIGGRLEEARAAEAELLQTVAELSEQASEQSEQLADIETRLQGARQEEAELSASVAEARDEAADLEARQASLEQSVAQQQDHRAALSVEIEQAEEQRMNLQGQVAELANTLAERSQQMADMEARIASVQSGTSDAVAASASGLQPGRHIGLAPSPSNVRIEARFEEDGSFELRREGREMTGSADVIAGQYELANGELTLSDAEGDTGTAEFPMVCAIEPSGGGFLVPDGQQADGCMLSGITFLHAE